MACRILSRAHIEAFLFGLFLHLGLPPVWLTVSTELGADPTPAAATQYHLPNPVSVNQRADRERGGNRCR
jgi:hypothetical protein